MIPHAVSVHATQGRTRTPEETAELLLNKITSISKDRAPHVYEQAIAFRNGLHIHIAKYIRMAIEEERDACASLARQGGSLEIESAIRGR